MELHQFHQFLGKHRPHFGPLVSVPPFPPPDISYNFPVYTPLHFNVQYSTYSVSPSHGIGSGFEFYHDIPLEQPRSRKRRRVDGSSPMSQSHATFEQGDLEKSSALPSYDRHEHGQSSSSPLRYVEPIMSAVQSSNSPLARGVAGLSLMLCPCCGFNSWRQSGHQPLVETSPTATVYDPKEPYMVEKSLCMPESSPPHDPTALDLGHTAAGGHYDTPHPPTNYPVQDYPLAPAPPLIDIDDGSSGQNTTASGSYQTQPVKAEPQVLKIVPLTLESPDSSDQSPTQCDPKIFPASTPSSSLQSPDGLVSYDPPQSGVPLGTYESLDPVPSTGWSNAVPYEQQSSFDILLPNQRGGKRGPFKDLTLREQTAQTRKIGSCIRCRMQRIRCENNSDEPGGNCLTCKKVANTKAGRFPCLRYKITDVRLYKPGQVPGYEWTRRWNNNISDPIQKWASSDVKVIHVSEGYSRQSIELRVRRFVPQDGDRLERSWDSNGSKRSVTIPPYALVDLEEGRKSYTKYICDSMIDTFPRILGRRDGLLYKTYLQAWRLCRDPSISPEALQLLNWTFKLWMSIRLSTASVFIVGDETLGMDKNILDETNPNHGKIPVPPVLGAQMDLILIHHIQTKLRREVLDRLQKLTLKNKQENWLLTYLVIFMLLHNAAMITSHDAGYARKHGMKRRFAREDKVREYHLGANILLAHFHYCNKGLHPFSDDCKDQELRSLADLDDDKVQFVRLTRQYARRHKVEWEELQRRGAYENDYFFISQLFEDNWQPGDVVC